jgi:hypothetical protein
MESLLAARAAFVEHAAEVYASGAAAARDDADRLEALADRLLTLADDLEPALDRLDVARDVALYRGVTLARCRSRCDPRRLAALMAEALAGELLSARAGAVLVAATQAARR